MPTPHPAQEQAAHASVRAPREDVRRVLEAMNSPLLSRAAISESLTSGVESCDVSVPLALGSRAAPRAEPSAPARATLLATAYALAQLRHTAQCLAQARAHTPMPRPASFLISGTNGAIGHALVPFLLHTGHSVARLIRAGAPAPRDPRTRDFPWSPGGQGAEGQLEASALAGVDVVVHLAGSPVLGRTKKALAQFRESRVTGTRTVARAVARAAGQGGPRTLIVASGVGYYGDRGDEVLTEGAGVGSGTFAEVARDWEASCEPARQAGVRVVNLRIGIMLSREAGALRAMIPTFRLGLGCVPGSGAQWWSWISREDVLGAILHIAHHAELAGGINVGVPAPVTAREFCSELAGALGRPLYARLPAWALRPVLGYATEGVIASTRMAPEALRASGFHFESPRLAPALRRELGLATPDELGVSVRG